MTQFFFVAIVVGLSFCSTFGSEESDDQLVGVLEALEKKNAIDFKLEGGVSFKLIPGSPRGKCIGLYRIAVGKNVRVFQNGRWMDFPDKKLDSALFGLLNIAQAEKLEPNIRIEIGDDAEAKVLGRVIKHLAQFHERRPQLNQMRHAYISMKQKRHSTKAIDIGPTNKK